MNLLDILSTSLHYFCRKCIEATKENSNFYLRVYRVNTAIHEFADLQNVWPLRVKLGGLQG